MRKFRKNGVVYLMYEQSIMFLDRTLYFKRPVDESDINYLDALVRQGMQLKKEEIKNALGIMS